MIGTKLAHYEITSHLGSGGMGDVYQATDGKLGRRVAIKLLPEAFTHDAERAARFEREARVLASLNHSHIAGIHGLEESGGRKFLVMELVEGETLAERIQRGPIPVEESLTMAKQICEALESAHEKGITHRDLKPANIKVTPDGAVKILDFGLAKAYGPDPGNVDLSNSPTLSMAATNAGVILGTAAYMSPEQAKGREVDKRTDIFAFGAVLYEMLTGRPAFGGENVADILSRVLQRDPDWTLLPANVPTAIQKLLRLCLEKNARNRRSDATDVRLDIEQALAEPKPSVAAMSGAMPTRSPRLAWTMFAAAALMAAVLAIPAGFYLRETPAPELRLEIATPPGPTDLMSQAISPDGQKIVFVAASEGIPRLWVRLLDDVSVQPLPRTDFAFLPFWSPDSRSIGFFAGGTLKRMDITGGLPQVLSSAPSGGGGSWNRDGTILFNPDTGRPVFAISATGGEPTPVTKVESPKQLTHAFPEFLPDGQHFLYYSTGTSEARGIYVGQLGGSETRRLLDADSRAVYAASGHLLFVRQGRLFAQSFDPVRMEVSGDPSPVAEQVAFNPGTGAAALSASAAGPISYRTGLASTSREFIWYDRSGRETGKVGGPVAEGMSNPSLSPDGLQLALTRGGDIWLLDMARGVFSRFTSQATTENMAIWSPDGKRIVFHSNEKGQFDLYQKPVTAGGSEELLLATPQTEVPTDWSHDGRFLLYRSTDPVTLHDIWALPLDGDQKPFPVVQTNFQDRDAQFSPDGKWIAYQSDESGRFEIYVQSFPGRGGRVIVSTTGGAQVRWRPDGKELYYITLDGTLMAVPIRFALGGQTVEAGTPVPLFATRVGGAVQGTIRQQYVVSPDGQRFLMNTVVEEAHTAPITVILNWHPEQIARKK